jgi:hypothetical protein
MAVNGLDNQRVSAACITCGGNELATLERHSADGHRQGQEVSRTRDTDGYVETADMSRSIGLLWRSTSEGHYTDSSWFITRMGTV